MGRVIDYLTQHVGMRATLFYTGLLASAISFYLGIGLYLFPNADHPYSILDWLLPIPFLLIAVGIDIFISWLAHRSGDRSFVSVLFRNSALLQSCGAAGLKL
jgi:hypothetical protein